jgi:O-antigen/teichoic acid export membrane protein
MRSPESPRDHVPPCHRFISVLMLRRLCSSPARAAAVLGLLGQLGNGVLQVLLVPVLLWRLDAGAVGLWQVLFATFLLAQMVELGLSQGIVRRLGDSLGGPMQAVTARATRILLWMVGGLFAVAFAIAALVMQATVAIPPAWHGDAALGALLFGLWGALRFRCAFARLAAYAGNRLLASAAADLAIGCGRPLAALLAVLLWPRLWVVPAAYVLVEAAVFLVLAWRCVLPPAPPAAQPLRPVLRGIVGFGLGNAAVGFASQVSTYFSTVLVAGIDSVHAALVHRCNSQLPALAQQAGYVPAGVLYPRLLAGSAGGGPDALRQLLRRWAWLGAVSLLTLSAAVALANPFFVAAWVGPELRAGWSFAIAMGCFTGLMILRHSALTVVRARHDHLRGNAIAHLIEAGLVLGLGWWAMRTWGLAGIAWTVTLAHLIPTVVAVQQVRSLLRRTAVPAVP